MPLLGLLKPEYLYRPRQLLRRLFQGTPSAATVEALLPWGARLRVHPRDDLGSAVCTLGLFDLVVTEALWRLADPGETAIDAGANLGYMTAVLGHRVSPGGRVFSFEPHPVLFQELSENIALQREGHRVDFRATQAALGEKPGSLTLRIPADFASNRGVASIVTDANLADSGERIEVPARVLDEVLQDAGVIGVMKIDVEGFELPAFRGASELLKSRRIRDIVFEHHDSFPSPVSTYLAEMGMTLFRLHREFRRPVLLAPDSALPRTKWESTSYLATYDPDRMRARFAPSGWRCLASRGAD
jgi:FkbM family methyltransferase